MAGPGTDRPSIVIGAGINGLCGALHRGEDRDGQVRPARLRVGPVRRSVGHGASAADAEECLRCRPTGSRVPQTESAAGGMTAKPWTSTSASMSQSRLTPIPAMAG